jgi:two-component system chemotaxis response regulator CheY
MTGLEFLKKVRSDDRFKPLPFLLITAENEKSQVMEAVQLGVSQYVVKPFTPETLKEKLEMVYKKINSAA